MVASFTTTTEAASKDASPTVLSEPSGPWLRIRGVQPSWACCHTHSFKAFRPRLISEALHTLAPYAEGVFHILL